MEQKTSENRILAFIDLLGIKNIIKNNEKKFNELLSAIYTIRNIKSSYQATSTPTNVPNSSYIDITPDFLSFSDHMIISVPIKQTYITVFDHFDEVHFCTAFASVINLINSLHLQMLELGVAIRGGITFDEVYYDSNCNIIIGPALVDAVDAESNIAIYPRVIVTKNILKKLMEYKNDACTGYNLSPDKFADFLRLKMDSDGVYFADYLGEAFKQIKANKRDVAYLSEIKKQIENNFENLNIENQKARVKWRWIANYYNSCLEKAAIEKPDSFYTVEKFYLTL